MAKTIMVCGYGPGISKAVAEKFGAEGVSVALVGRSGDKLAAGVKALEAKGVKAAAVTADFADPGAARDAVKKARVALRVGSSKRPVCPRQRPINGDYVARSGRLLPWSPSSGGG